MFHVSLAGLRVGLGLETAGLGLGLGLVTAGLQQTSDHGHCARPHPVTSLTMLDRYPPPDVVRRVVVATSGVD